MGSAEGGRTLPPDALRIAVVHNLSSGGAKRCVHEQIARLRVRHRVDVLTLATADLDFCDLRPLADRHTVLPYRSSRGFRRPFGRLNELLRVLDLLRLNRAYARMAELVDRRGYDVVLAHPCQAMQAPALLRHARCPSVYYCQEAPRRFYEPAPERTYLRRSRLQRLVDAVDPLPGLHRRMLCRLDASAARAAGALLVNSRFTKGNVESIYRREAEVLYLGVDALRFQPAPRADSSERYVLSVGALRADKGFDFLVEALALVPPRERPALRVVSNWVDPRERPYLEALARQQDVSLRIEVDIDEATLASRYRDAALVCYAPLREPFGFVPLEAMASGRAVVAVADGGVRETVVDGQTGRLVPRDASRFAEAVTDLLRRPEEARRMGEAGRREVEARWGWDASVERLETVLRRVARSDGPRTPEGQR